MIEIIELEESFDERKEFPNKKKSKIRWEKPTETEGRNKLKN